MIPTWKDIVLVCFCWARRLSDSRRRPADRHKRQVASVYHPLPHCRVFVVGRGRPYTTVDKILYQNILGLIAFLFTLFKGYRCNQLSVITPDNFLWKPEKKISNFTWIEKTQVKIFMCKISFCEIWSFGSLFSRAPTKTFSLELFHVTYYKETSRNAIQSNPY